MWLLLQTKYTVRERKKCFEPKFKEFKMQAMNICLFGKKSTSAMSMVFMIKQKKKKKSIYFTVMHSLNNCVPLFGDVHIL